MLQKKGLRMKLIKTKLLLKHNHNFFKKLFEIFKKLFDKSVKQF